MASLTKRARPRLQLAHTGMTFDPIASGRDYRRKQERRLRKQAQKPKQDKPSKGFQ